MLTEEQQNHNQTDLAQPATPDVEESPATAPKSPDSDQPSAPVETIPSQRQSLFDQVHSLHEQGQGILSIARDLNVSRQTVRRYLRHDQLPPYERGPGKPALPNICNIWSSVGPKAVTMQSN